MSSITDEWEVIVSYSHLPDIYNFLFLNSIIYQIISKIDKVWRPILEPFFKDSSLHVNSNFRNEFIQLIVSKEKSDQFIRARHDLKLYLEKLKMNVISMEKEKSFLEVDGLAQLDRVFITNYKTKCVNKKINIGVIDSHQCFYTGIPPSYPSKYNTSSAFEKDVIMHCIPLTKSLRQTRIQILSQCQVCVMLIGYKDEKVSECFKLLKDLPIKIPLVVVGVNIPRMSYPKQMIQTCASFMWQTKEFREIATSVGAFTYFDLEGQYSFGEIELLCRNLLRVVTHLYKQPGTTEIFVSSTTSSCSIS